MLNHDVYGTEALLWEKTTTTFTVNYLPGMGVSVVLDDMQLLLTCTCDTPAIHALISHC